MGLAIAMMVGATLVFSVLWVFVKRLAENYSIWEVSFFRNFFAMAPVIAMLMAKHGWRTLRVHRPLGHVWRGVVGVIGMVLGFTSYRYMPLADAVAISFVSPLIITALAGPLLGEKVGAFRWSVVLVGFCGVLIIVQPGSGMLQIGALVAIGAAFTGAVTAVTIRQLNKYDSSVAIVFYFTLFSTVMTAAPLPWVWQTPSATEWAMAITAGLMGGIGQYLMTQAYALAPAAVVGPFNYAGLLWAAGFGWLVWGDVPSWHVVTGAAIVMASGLTLLYRETHRRKRHE